MSYAHKWLRDGAIITGAIGNTYTLVEADQNTRIRTRTEYTLADATTGMMESQETSVVISGTDPDLSVTIQIDTRKQAAHGIIPEGREYFSQGFTTGGHASGYMVDRTHVRFGLGNQVSAVPKDEYKIHLMAARENFTGSSVVALLHNEGNAVPDALAFHQAPPGTWLFPNARYTVVMTDHSANHRFTCVYVDGGSEGQLHPDSFDGWGIHTEHNRTSNTDIYARYVAEATGSCKIIVTGREYAENVPHLRSLGITNTPENGYGFAVGDIVEVTAKFTGPVTGILSMPLILEAESVLWQRQTATT